MNKMLSTDKLNPDKPVKINIIIADDHPLLRKALKSLLEEQADFEIIAEADDGEEAVNLAEKYKPDVVIMDISMPKLNGLEATRQIKANNPDTIVLVLTVHDDSEHVLGILDAGAAGYLTKRVFGEEVTHAIRSVVAGETVLSGEISQRILKYASRNVTKPVPLDAGERLTLRDLEILNLAARGFSNKEIATELGLSLSTIKGYLSDIFSKMRVGSRTEAVMTALQAGILTLTDAE